MNPYEYEEYILLVTYTNFGGSAHRFVISDHLTQDEMFKALTNHVSSPCVASVLPITPETMDYLFSIYGTTILLEV